MRIKWFLGLALLALLVSLGSGCQAPTGHQSGLELDLKDIYFEKHYYDGTTTEVLVVNLMLENRGEVTIGISRSYFQDDAGIHYVTPIYPFRSLPEGECCKGIKRIVDLDAGGETDGYLMIYEPVPHDATGLTMTVETDEPGIEPLVLALPDAGLIRVLEFHDTAS